MSHSTAPGAGRLPSLSFWLRTGLGLLAPRLFSRTPLIEQKPEKDFVYLRDRHPVREKHNRDAGWKTETDADGLLRREYDTYDEYVTHQQQKLDEMLKAKGGFSRTEIFRYRLKFYSRFRHLVGRLPKGGTMLCLGARQGTEVEVLRDLGFARAYGIDLNPGKDNPLVRKGDFMHLEEADNSVDFLYTNCIDHAFDLEKFFSEHARVLQPEGYAIYDFGISEQQGGGAFEAISWKRTEDVVCRLLEHYRDLILAHREKDWLWVMVRGKAKS